MTYGSLLVTKHDGSDEVLATRDSDLDVWTYQGAEYITVLFVGDPNAESIREIAVDSSDR